MSLQRRAIKRSLRVNFTPGARDYYRRAALAARCAVHAPSWIRGSRLEMPIFLIGAPRSGTSMLYAIVTKSSLLAHRLWEAHEVWEADYHPAMRGWESNVLTASDVEDEAARRIMRSFYLAVGNRKRLIDKTPRNTLRVGFIDALFPDARFIFLKRDGRANVSSLINAWRTSAYRTYELPEPHRIPGVDPRWWKFTLYPGWQQDRNAPLEVVCAKQWKLSNDYALKSLTAIGRDRWIEVAYEELVEDPAGETGRLMSWLGLEYEEAVRAKAKAARTKPINVVTPPERGKWRRENPEEIEAILPLITPTMRALGYELDDS